jgi:O-antigen/teichoic acid export membrane protein
LTTDNNFRWRFQIVHLREPRRPFSGRAFSVYLFGVGGSEGRDRDRYLRAARSIAFKAVSAAPGLTVVLLSVSFTLPYLGQERFGIWMTISSLAVMLSVLDFGVANGLVNLVASAGATEDHDRLRTIVTRGLTVLAVIGLVAATVLIAALSMLDLPRLLKIESEPVAKEAALSTLVFIALFCVNIPLGRIRKVFHGLQRAWEPHVASSIGYFCSLPLLYLCAHYRAPIPYLVGATYGVQTLATMILFARLYKEDLICTRPNLFSEAGWRNCKVLVSKGGLFLILQIGMTVEAPVTPSSYRTFSARRR